MSKLTTLEKNSINNLVKILVEIRDSGRANSDNISDFIFDQLPISTDDPAVLEAIKNHLKLIDNLIEDVVDDAITLQEHFGTK